MAGVNGICKQKMSQMPGNLEQLLRAVTALRNFRYFEQKSTIRARQRAVFAGDVGIAAG